MSDDEIVTEDQAVYALLKSAPDVITEYFQPDSCIASAVVGMEALRYYGIESSPLSVSALIMNDRACEIVTESGHMIERGDPRAEEYIASGYWVSRIGKTGQKRSGKWDGHLVIATSKYMVDLTLGRVQGPESGIQLEPSSFQRPEPGMRQAGYAIPGGGFIIYTLYPDDASYEAAPDWNRDRWRDVCAKIIRAMKPMVGRRN